MAEQRLIDANALIKGFEDAGFGDHSLIESVLAAGVYARIENAPTIDAVPVVHARWEPIDGTGDGIYKLWRCSSCKNGRTVGSEPGPDVPYCFSCGAKMDGGAKT